MSKLKLVGKIVSVIKEVGAVPKTSENKFHGYKYRSHEAIANKLQPALAAAGIIIVPAQKKLIANEPGYVLMEVTYQVTDGEEELSFVGIGEGQDKSKEGKPGDKSVYKAQTGAMKYALNDLLMLAGEDPEEDQATHKDSPAGTVTNHQDSGASKLSFEATSQMKDMMNEMGWTEKRQELVLKKAEQEGEKVIMEKVVKEYELFCEWKAKQAMTPAGGTDDVKF